MKTFNNYITESWDEAMDELEAYTNNQNSYISTDSFNTLIDEFPNTKRQRVHREYKDDLVRLNKPRRYGMDTEFDYELSISFPAGVSFYWDIFNTKSKIECSKMYNGLLKEINDTLTHYDLSQKKVKLYHPYDIIQRLYNSNIITSKKEYNRYIKLTKTGVGKEIRRMSSMDEIRRINNLPKGQMGGAINDYMKNMTDLLNQIA